MHPWPRRFFVGGAILLCPGGDSIWDPRLSPFALGGGGRLFLTRTEALEHIAAQAANVVEVVEIVPGFGSECSLSSASWT